MNLSEFQQGYHMLLVFSMDLAKIKHLSWRGNLSVNQIELLLSIIRVIMSRLNTFQTYLIERRCELNEKKNEQTLF